MLWHSTPHATLQRRQQPQTRDHIAERKVNAPRIADTSAQDVAIVPRSKRKQWLLGGGAAGLAVVALAVFALPALERWAEADMSVSRERLRTATVTRGDLVRDVSVQGRVVAPTSPTLYTTQPGVITFQVASGARVAAGDVLATVHSPQVENELRREEAHRSRLAVQVDRQRIHAKQLRLTQKKAVDLAEMELVAAKREARRADLGFANESVSQLDFEQAHDQKRAAELAHEHAVRDAELQAELLDFELRTTELDLERQALLVADLQRQVEELAIRSPVDGVVGNRLVENKTAVAPNMPVLAVVDLSRFEVEADVPESYSDDLAPGMAAEVRVGGRSHDAELTAVSPEVRDNQVTVRLRFVNAMPAGLRQNQRLTARVLLEAKHDVLRVARGQFLESGAGRIAYVIKDGVARRVAIDVGAHSLNAVEILAGLAEGDEVVVSSLDAFDGKEAVLIAG